MTKVDSKAFQIEMRKNGHTLDSLAQVLGLSRTGLFNKIHNKSEFKASEMSAIGTLFKLSKTKKDAIFFASNVE
jgi:hypothetical protein